MDIFLSAFLWIFATLLVVIFASYLTKKIGEKVLVSFYSILVVISAITATKLINIFGLTVPAGVVVYAASFLITDIISEVYGKKSAVTAVWLGLVSMVIFYGYALITVYWQPAEYWPHQESYATIIGLSVRITLAGIIAFIISQLNDVTVFHYLKGKHERKKLALRNILSTSISQLIDTIIFITIAFYGVFDIIPLIIGQYLIKLIIAFLDTPFVYWGRYILTEKE